MHRVPMSTGWRSHEQRPDEREQCQVNDRCPRPSSMVASAMLGRARTTFDDGQGIGSVKFDGVARSRK